MTENPRGPVTVLRIKNRREVLIDFFLEPLGEMHPMPPGAVFEFVSSRPVNEVPLVEATQDGLMVWCDPWVEVFHEGKRLGT